MASLREKVDVKLENVSTVLYELEKVGTFIHNLVKKM